MPWSARRRANCSPTRKAMLDRIIDEKWLTAKAVCRPVAGQQRRRRHRARCVARRRGIAAEPPCTSCASRPTSRIDRPELLPGRFHRAAGQRQAGLDRRLRGDRRHRHRRARRPLRGRPRRLQRDPAQGAGRPPGRSLRRMAARKVRTRVLGLRAGRGAGQRGADRREVPRHPPRARLSGLPRAQREGDAVPPARRRRTPSACS